MQGSDNDSAKARPSSSEEPQVAEHRPLQSTARSSTARGGSAGCAQESIGHAHQWLVRGDAPPPPASGPATPVAVPRMAAMTPSHSQWPSRRHDPSASFYVGPEGPRAEESSPFAGVALERGSRPGQATTSPGVAQRPQPTTPTTDYRTPANVGMVSSALAGLPIQRPRVHSAHGASTTPTAGPTSSGGAGPASPLLALPDIPTYASPIHPLDVDVHLAFEALFQGALGSRDAAHVAARMWRQTVPAGRPIFSAGEPAECAFVLATGLGRVEVPGPVETVALTPLRTGDLIGLAALTGEPLHDHTAVAASDLVVFCLRREEFHKLCTEAPQLAQRVLAAGLTQASRRIRAQAERMLAYAQLDGHDAAVQAAHAEPQGSRLGRFFARLAGGKENG